MDEHLGNVTGPCPHAASGIPSPTKSKWITIVSKMFGTFLSIWSSAHLARKALPALTNSSQHLSSSFLVFMAIMASQGNWYLTSLGLLGPLTRGFLIHLNGDRNHRCHGEGQQIHWNPFSLTKGGVTQSGSIKLWDRKGNTHVCNGMIILYWDLHLSCFWAEHHLWCCGEGPKPPRQRTCSHQRQ